LKILKKSSGRLTIDLKKRRNAIVSAQQTRQNHFSGALQLFLLAATSTLVLTRYISVPNTALLDRWH